jgi:4-amino-4-deoxy-L-arabinose transferase-like glycosyltransferase
MPPALQDYPQTAHVQDSQTAGSRVLSRYRTAILLSVVLVLAAIVISHRIHKGEFNVNIDEAYDATTGLYVADFIRDLPVALAHPVQYTYAYYAQYPALGLIHWPPFFHFIEGIIFLAFGPSVVSARITVLLFALFGLFFWFKLVAALQNEWTATVCTVVLSCLPAVLLYEKAVMLEIPSLALCIAASYFWLQYLDQAKSWSLYWCSIFAGLALLTKQQGVYLALFFLLSAFGLGKWRQLLSRPILWSTGIVLAIAGPFYVLELSIDRQSVAANILQGVDRVPPNRFTFYLQALPQELGWVLLGLSILGVLLCWRYAKRQSFIFMSAWIVGWYLTYFVISTKQARYMVYWLPPFIFFAVAPLTSRVLPKLARMGAAAVALALVCGYTWAGWHYERPYIVGYKALATEVLDRDNGGIVLFDGDLEGNYIFFMRALDPQRRFVVLRKALYATRVMPQFGSVELVHSKEDIEEILGEYGIKYVAVESNAPLRFNAQKVLRDLLATPQFKLVRSIPIESNLPEWNARSLLLYENLQAKPRTARELRLTMLSMSHDIVVPLDDLLKH